MKRNLFFLLMLATTLGLVGCEDSAVVGPESSAVDEESALEKQYDRMSRSDVIAIADASTVGTSQLGRSPNRVAAVLKTTGIPDGQAVTLWWVVFNHPEACATTPCDEPDLFDPDVEADILYADGKQIRNGKATFTGTLGEGDVYGSVADVFALPAASGLHDAETAEVHLIVRSHGPAVPGQTREQLTTLNGGCQTELPVGEMPDEAGECADIQFAVHQAKAP